MRIQVGDLKIGELERKKINNILDVGIISEGRNVSNFEKEWANYIGTKYSILLNSGTSALIAGLKALMIKNKMSYFDSVITTPLTYIATSNAIIHNNLTPHYVDIDKDTFNITPEKIKESLEDEIHSPPSPKIILPVHLFGYPCDMNGINKIAKKYGLIVMEDAAQSHGSVYEGKRTGALSDLGIFSFFVAHNIQAGEMGAITSNDLKLIKLIRQIKANGRLCDCDVCRRGVGICPKMGKQDPRFTHQYFGYNFKATEFPAAIASAQLTRIDENIIKRQNNVYTLNCLLNDFTDILDLPSFSPDVSYLAYPIVIKDTKKIKRHKLCSLLEKRGIETRPIFGCIPTQQPAYTKYFKKIYNGRLPNAEYVGKNGFYIGCHQYLNDDDLTYIYKSFAEILK